jgi:hypothetical protein
MVVRGAPARRRSCCCVAVLASLALTTAPAKAGPRQNDPIGVHSMLYLDTPFGGKEAMFEEAAAVGASTIRVDIALSSVFPNAGGPADWTGVDQYMTLARRYHLSVLADLLATPWYLASCPAGTSFLMTYRCPPFDPAAWGRDAGLIAAHTRGTIDRFEIINEPDGTWAFIGSPEQYAEILAASYDQIHAADPNAQVVLGGVMNPASHAWIDAVLATPGVRTIRKFDIANIHVRTSPAQAAPTVSGWRHYLAARGFHGPLWVTETGYPADPAFQTDPGYRDGPISQAGWMTTVIPAMICAGAAKVFVTERDALTGRFASEGFLQTADPLPADPSYLRRPSFYVIRALAQAESRQASAGRIACTAVLRARRATRRAARSRSK